MGTLLVARTREIDAVRAAIDGPAAGVVVYGEAGVGKTALVRAALAGLPVREGGALATLTWTPYFSLRRAFGDDLADEVWAGDVEHVAEQIERALDDDLLHVDDAQWAHPSTRRVLQALVGRCRLVVTVRRGDPGAVPALDGLTDAGLARLDLEPLAPADATELVLHLNPRLGPAEVTSLVQRSGGNPLLLEELTDADADIATLHRAVLARCRQLPENQLEDLAMVVLASRPLRPADLADAPSLAETGIVVIDDEQVTVRHALIGEVVDDLLTEDRQLRCHRALARLHDHPGDRARHLLAAGDLDAAHEAAMAAVADALTPGERIAHLEVAARCLDPDDGAEFRLRAAEEASEVDLDEIAAALLDGLPDRADLRHRIQRQHYHQALHHGETARLLELTAASAASATPGTGEEVLSLMDQSFAIVATTGVPERLAEALALAERAVELSERIDAERSAALKAHADALFLMGDERWREVMPAAIAQARREGNVAREWRIANNWISALQTYGPIAEGIALAEDLVTQFDALRLGNVRRNFEFRRMNLLANLADYPAILAGVPALLESPGMASVMTVDLHCTLAEAEIQTGALEAGLARLQAGPATSSERGLVEVHRIMAEVHLDANRPDLAAAELAAFDDHDVGLAYHTMVAPTRAWTARALDRPAPPRPELLPESGMFAGVAPELDAIDALRRDDMLGAAGHFARAVEAYRDRYVSRMVRCAWFEGEALRLAGAPAAADTLVAAEREARIRGMVPIRIHCERSLRALGVRRSAQVVRSAASPLTERETEISKLVADGLTDGEIAHRLGLQRRTVQTVLATARRKLGAENRAHLIRLVTESSR